MKICIAQTKSKKGEIQFNIENHLRLITRAISFNSNIIIFPELSITNYEPKLAKEFAASIDDDIFSPFQELSNNHQIVIGAGMPTQAANGINISILLFQPNKQRMVYSKCLLHSDENPYFVSSNNQPFLKIQEKKVAFGICYETLQRAHFVKAKENGADIYIASVAKPNRGISKAYLHFPSMAKEFATPILMSNAVGYCDNFLSNGLSAAWNRKGKLVGQLDDVNQGLLIYDTETETTEIAPIIERKVI